MITREYIDFLEMLPCNRQSRRRQRQHGEWMAGWVPDTKARDFTEPMQQAFIERDAPSGVMAKLVALIRH